MYTGRPWITDADARQTTIIFSESEEFYGLDTKFTQDRDNDFLAIYWKFDHSYPANEVSTSSRGS
jgi:hypothetical protein